MEIVVINGTGGSGKDSFVKEVINLLGENRCYNYSTVDFIKYVAVVGGWKGGKTPKDRKFLSDLKKAFTEWNDTPYKITEQEIETVANSFYENGHLHDSVMFIHCREPEEIDRLVNGFMAHTLLVKRAAADEVQQINDSDNGVYDYNYDCIVENNGTIEDLNDAARTYITKILCLEV
jgi:dephospho-CoA kinase